MKISVIGCGYLGAVHAACMAKLGHSVLGYDTDERKIQALSKGESPFFEPGLDDLLASVTADGSLAFTSDLNDISDSEVHFVCVGTPQHADRNAADLTYVWSAIDNLIPFLKEGAVVVGKSTVPVGTAQKIAEKFETGKHDVALVWNPEFLREGFAIRDTLNPDRIVYGLPSGGLRESALVTINRVYKGLMHDNMPVIETDYATAELVKVAANSFLATKISFINAMAEVCEATGADVTALADAIGHDDRIGRKFLNAGLGFGGGCLPKDIRAFMARSEELGVDQALAFLRDVDAINMRRRARMVELAVEVCGGSLQGKKIAVLGLSFKPNSDDIRDSPALDVALELARCGADVIATDPKALANVNRLKPELQTCSSWREAVLCADLVVLLTEWTEYSDLRPSAMKDLVGSTRILDGRNALEPSMWRDAGWTYRALGRP